MTPQSRFRIAVVGGGTAGWLSALMLSKTASDLRLDVDVTVVESSKIPTIGVGEGTTAVFRGMLEQLGLDEFEFLRQTDATIKYGIRHRDWRRLGHQYDGPIDDPHLTASAPPDAASGWLNQYCVAAGRSVTQPHLFTYLMDKARAPFAFGDDGRLVPLGPYHHAFHFDQAQVGVWLRGKATGIKQLDAIVEGAVRAKDSGDITALQLAGGGELDVDFVIDCSGFRRALIRQEMGAAWIGYGDRLPVNRAMPFWLDHQDDDPLLPLTLAWAQKSGWLWQIPTQQRMGCGYVYCDQFLSPEQAQDEIEAVLGHPIEPRNDIRIDAGRLDRAWIGNCLAVGLAQSFFEPLEATSIHGTIVQLMLFALRHLEPVVAGHADPASYNLAAARQCDDFCDFINLHYVSERDDTPFWRHVRHSCIAPQVRERLALWQTRTPGRDDFAPFPEGLPHIEDQLYVPVLDGLGLLSRETARGELKASPQVRAHARKTVEFFTREFGRAAMQAPSHREFLDRISAA